MDNTIYDSERHAMIVSARVPLAERFLTVPPVSFDTLHFHDGLNGCTRENEYMVSYCHRSSVHTAVNQ